ISYGIDGDNITYITDECGEKLDVLYKKGSESEKNLKDESVKVALDGKDDTESIVWNLVDPSNMKSEPCTTNVSGVGSPAELVDKLADKTLVIDGKTDGNTCEADTLFSFDDVKNELVKTDNCAGISSIKYEIKDSEDNVVANDVLTEGTNITEWLSKGDYTVTWTVTDGDNKTYPSVDQKFTVEDKVAPAIECPADISAPVSGVDEGCKTYTLLTTQLLKNAYLEAHESTDITGDITNNSDKKAYAYTKDAKGNVDKVYDECGEELSFYVGLTKDEQKSEVEIESSIDDDKTPVYWTMKDASGNASNCTSYVTPVDTTKPEIAQTLDSLKLNALSESDKCEGKADLTSSSIRDMLKIQDCSKTDISYVINRGDGTKSTGDVDESNSRYRFDEKLTADDEIEWIVTDKSGNADTVKQFVGIVDKIAPVVDCEKLIPDVIVKDAEIASGICVDFEFLKKKGLFTTENKPSDRRYISDNCTAFEDIKITSKRSDVENVDKDNADFDAPFKVGKTVVNWYFTDEAGNSTFCPQHITIPNNPPAIVCGPSEVDVQITHANNCKMSYEKDDADVIADLRRGELIEQHIIDAEGNILKPELTKADIDKMLAQSDCGNELMLKYTIEGSEDTISGDVNIPFEEFEKPVTVTYIVYDKYGNNETCTVTYNPVDEESPYVAANRFSSTIYRNDNCQYVYKNTKEELIAKVNAEDCSEDMYVFYEIGDAAPVELTDEMAYEDFDSKIGVDSIKWTIKDKFGNDTTVVETINKADEIAPAIACPAEPIKLPINNNCNATYNLSDSQIIAIMRANAIPLKTETSIINKYMGPDLFKTLSKDDQFAVTHDCDESVKLLVSDGTEFTETTSVPVDLAFGKTTTIKFEIQDSTGNASSCDLTFAAVDTTAPKIADLDTVKLYYKEDECMSVYDPTYEEIKTLLNIDDCDENTTISYTVDGKTVELKSTDKLDLILHDKDVKDITWTVTDGSDNSSSTPQVVMAFDTIAPKFDCSKLKSELIVVLKQHGEEATFEMFENVGLDTSIYVMDNCDGKLKPSFYRGDDKHVYKDIYPSKDTTILFTSFTDNAGKYTYCQQNLIVLDSIKPQIVCPHDYDKPFACVDDVKDKIHMPKNFSEFKQYLFGNVLDAQNMIPEKLTVKDDTAGNSCESVITRTYTIYDIFGDSSSCANKIIVKDTVPPVWTKGFVSGLKTDSMFLSCEASSVNWPIPTAEDGCNAYSVNTTTEKNQGTDRTKCDYYNYEKTFTYTATDVCGNTNPDTFRMVLAYRDENKPHFDVPEWFADGVVSAESDGKCLMLVPDLESYVLNREDPCASTSALTYSQIPAAGTSVKDNITAQMILTDACGNNYVYKKEITVPNREDILTAYAHDFIKCEGTELDITLMSDTIITATGKSYILQDDKTYKVVDSDIAFDVYKDSISIPTIVYSNNMNTYGLRFASDPVAKYASINSITNTGTYFYVAEDLNTGCKDTAYAYIGIRQRPRVAMSNIDTVEACEYQALAVNGVAGNYKEKFNICVEDMGAEIIEEGWMVGGVKYNDQPITHNMDGTRLTYYATNMCGTTSSDSSLAWRCEYVYNEENGTFESNLTTQQMLKDTVSKGAPMRVHQKINPDSMLLTAMIKGHARVWVGESVDLNMKSIYNDRTVEYHWYKVVGDMDATSQKFDGFGNILEDYINPLDDADELLAVSSVNDPDFGYYNYPSVEDTTLFYVVVTDNVCTSAASNVVKVDAYDFIPTAITPHNSKDMNDVFMPGYSVVIFNRYGNKVFEGEDGWDGTIRGELADPTVYYYILTMKDGSVRQGTIEVVYFK
ncbi:MAG: gliding motility-associated C-terminal domain-containing protein, partial [Bacteroidales bacterium]|nr:gliding motility-associated C-terminal domain-containing protein [Candidatus Scybalocola fimicaballi]